VLGKNWYELGADSTRFWCEIPTISRGPQRRSDVPRGDLKIDYSFCRYSTMSGLPQSTAMTNLRRAMPLGSMIVVSG